MKRREFITLLGGAAAALPLPARAQQSAMPVIGFLGSELPDAWASRLRAFRQGLSETGYVEGQNVMIEYRWAESHYDRLPALAADLVRRQVTVIAAPGSTPAVLATKAATSTIPIVFLIAADPVEIGLVASLNRPGGNLTGVTVLSVQLGPKLLEIVHEMVPVATNVALLVNPTNGIQTEVISKVMSSTARSLGLQLNILRASTERDIDGVFATLVQQRAGALVIGPDAFFSARLEQFAKLAIRNSVPAIYQFREFAAAGGLMSYGADVRDAFRLAGVYSGRLLKGDKPAALPVQQSAKVELVINLKTAKALGLNVPLPLLARANEVIE